MSLLENVVTIKNMLLSLVNCSWHGNQHVMCVFAKCPCPCVKNTDQFQGKEKQSPHEWQEASCGCRLCLQGYCTIHNRCVHIEPLTKPQPKKECLVNQPGRVVPPDECPYVKITCNCGFTSDIPKHKCNQPKPDPVEAELQRFMNSLTIDGASLKAIDDRYSRRSGVTIEEGIRSLLALKEKQMKGELK